MMRRKPEEVVHLVHVLWNGSIGRLFYGYWFQFHNINRMAPKLCLFRTIYHFHRVSSVLENGRLCFIEGTEASRNWTGLQADRSAFVLLFSFIFLFFIPFFSFCFWVSCSLKGFTPKTEKILPSLSKILIPSILLHTE